VARTARSGSRIDIGVFAGCVILAIAANVLPPPMREPLAATLRRSIMSPLVGLQLRAERWRMAWLASRALVMQRDSATLRAADAEALRIENDQLRKLLGLGGRLQTGFIPAEALYQPGRPEEIVTTVTLSAGSNAGVAEYSPVVSDSGVVGLVQKVDPTMSVAILYSNPDFRVSAMTTDGAAFGIVYPHLVPGSERYLLEFGDVPLRAPLQRGTVIVSSGFGGAFPKGIPVGTILSAIRTNESWVHTYLVKPAVNPAAVTSVLILTRKRVTQGVGNVWATPGDSATRALAAVADSVAKRAALEAGRRRARADSIKADSVRRDPARKVP